MIWAKRSAEKWAEKFNNREGADRKELGEAIQRYEERAVTGWIRSLTPHCYLVASTYKNWTGTWSSDKGVSCKDIVKGGRRRGVRSVYFQASSAFSTIPQPTGGTCACRYLRSPGQAPYGATSACAKRAAPDECDYAAMGNLNNPRWMLPLSHVVSVASGPPVAYDIASVGLRPKQVALEQDTVLVWQLRGCCTPFTRAPVGPSAAMH